MTLRKFEISSGPRGAQNRARLSLEGVSPRGARAGMREPKRPCDGGASRDADRTADDELSTSGKVALFVVTTLLGSFSWVMTKVLVEEIEGHHVQLRAHNTHAQDELHYAALQAHHRDRRHRENHLESARGEPLVKLGEAIQALWRCRGVEGATMVGLITVLDRWMEAQWRTGRARTKPKKSAANIALRRTRKVFRSVLWR